MKNRTIQLTQASVTQLSELLEKKQISAVELTDVYLDAVAARDGEIGAYLTVTADEARKTAAEIDRRRVAGETLSPLAGIPMALKDNICTRGIRTTCASRMLGDWIPPYDAHVTERLTSAGAVLLGKLNMDEFAMGSSTENSAFQRTHNPRDLSRVPGGSSGGSAAAVAGDMAAFTLGSDTGGSIRQPASFCGVVGMKPTYGTVSRYGLVAFASSLDQIGPLTRTVRDSALVLDAIAGRDVRDATSVQSPAAGKFSAEIGKGIKGLKIGVIDECFGDGLAPDVKSAVLSALSLLEKQGAELVRCSIPSLDDALAAYYVISSAEASSNLARFDGVRYGYRASGFSDIDELYCKSRSEGFGAEVKRRIMLGTFALSSGYYDAYYKKAQEVRARIAGEFAKVFSRVDTVLTPVAPTVAYKLGEKTSDPLAMYLGDVYSVPANVAGLPAISLPAGVGEGGMPVGVQFVGSAFSEPLLYRAAAALESILGGVPQ